METPGSLNHARVLLRIARSPGAGPRGIAVAKPRQAERPCPPAARPRGGLLL
jgi:hypothetical protein